MVTVTNFQERKSLDGKAYFALEIQSDELEFVLSQNTGKHYATVRKCWISSTFNELMCKNMIGKSMVGTIRKVECEPYEFTIPESGEVITRTHNYDYSPVESQNTERIIMQEQVFS
jgi:hypothetical protein